MRGSLDLRRLRYFLAIADAGSVSAAARVLNLAQPALSYHLGELERLTGHVLCDRSRDGVTLTRAGRLLRGHAQEIVTRVDAAERSLESLVRRGALPAGQIRVAIISSLAADLMPILVESTTRAMPAVTLRIIEAGTHDILRKLKRGEVDMAIYLTGAPGASEQPIAHERLYYVAARGSSEGAITLADLAQQPLVLPAAGNPLRDYVDAAARRLGLALDVVLEVDGSRSRSRAVLKGIGGTVFGAHSVAADALEPGLVVREIVAPQLFRPIFLSARRDLDPVLASRMPDLLVAGLARLGLAPVETGPGAAVPAR